MSITWQLSLVSPGTFRWLPCCDQVSSAELSPSTLGTKGTHKGFEHVGMATLEAFRTGTLEKNRDTACCIDSNLQMWMFSKGHTFDMNRFLALHRREICRTLSSRVAGELGSFSIVGHTLGAKA